MTNSNFTPNYSERMSQARAGQVANMALRSFISRNVETDPGIPFGRVVQRGVRDDSCKSDLAGITAGSYLGITIRDRGVRATFPNGHSFRDAARVARKADGIWVEVKGAVEDGTAATVRLADGAFVPAGTAASFVLPNAFYDSTTTGDGLALVRLD